MATRRQPTTENRPINHLGRSDDETFQRYLNLVDDGELARLAAMMSPKIDTFDACALIAQAAALQAEASAELVRRREEMVKSMSLDTLSELAGHLGIRELGFLRVLHEDSIPDHPIQGPVLRGVAALMREMRPPQDFAEIFLADNPADALSRASSRTSLRRPLPDASFEELLRYAADIPVDEISWDILNDAFIDFLRIWFQNRLGMAELLASGSKSEKIKPGDSDILASIERLRHERTRFYESFKPGHDFPPDIVELAHRAYTECWEDGILRSLWQRRLAWLADEFTPFWQRFGEAYRAIYKARMEVAAQAEAAIRRDQNKKSAKARKAGGAGLQRRETKRWRAVTAEFVEFLRENFGGSSPSDLNGNVEIFVSSRSSAESQQSQNNTRFFLETLCTGVTNSLEARTVLDTLQRSLLAKIKALSPALREQRLNKLLPNQRKQYLKIGTIPPSWVQFKSLSEEAVGDCLDDLKHALSKECAKKSKK